MVRFHIMIFSFGAGLGSTPAAWLVILSPIIMIGILSVKNIISNIVMEAIMNPTRQTLTANVIASRHRINTDRNC